MIKVETVTMLPATIRQVHVLTLKRVQQPWKQSKMQSIHVSETRFREEKVAEQRRAKEQAVQEKEKQQAGSSKQLLKLSQLLSQHRLLN